jgi:hypothetical protein
VAEIVSGAMREYTTYAHGFEFHDAGACYSCCVQWTGMDEFERHVEGCPRLETPAGSPPEGQCWECGTTPSAEALERGVNYAVGPCPNEGGCSRYRDPFQDYSPRSCTNDACAGCDVCGLCHCDGTEVCTPRPPMTDEERAALLDVMECPF